jgi:NADH-quinone oxidoreductase subunit F
MEDLQKLEDISKTIGTIPGTTICGLADGAAWPIKNALQKFRPELEEFIRSGRKSEMREVALAH